MRGWTASARESFWFLPALFGIAALVLAQVLVTVDHAFGASIGALPFFDQTSADGARSIVTTIGTSMLTVAGTSFSITISVLATTSSTYGPRLVRNFMADRSNQFVLAMFTSTFLYSLLVGRAVRTPADDRAEFVPTLGIHVAVLLAVVDVAVLVYFIHHIASSVQITTLQKRVQVDLVRALDQTVPAGLPSGWARAAGAPEDAVHPVRSVGDGYVQQIDLAALVRLATEHGVVVDVTAMPGDHVIRGDALLRLDGQVTETLAKRLRRTFTIGIARTPAQDVRFALQQLTEVSIRGLAAGSNDPYTSVSALQLAQAALVPLVQRDPAPQGRLDAAGTLRVVVHPPSTEQLLLAVLDSVRHYGLDHRAVVEAAFELAGRLAEAARALEVREALRHEAGHLLRAYEQGRPDPEDLAVVRARAESALARPVAPGSDR